MRITTKGQYALVAMKDITTHTKGGPVRLQDVAIRSGISLHYLEQLLRKLRSERLVKSVRGPGGGYILARKAANITALEILHAVGEITSVKLDLAPVTKLTTGIESMFDDINQSIDTKLRSITLKDL